MDFDTSKSKSKPTPAPVITPKPREREDGKGMGEGLKGFVDAFVSVGKQESTITAINKVMDFNFKTGGRDKQGRGRTRTPGRGKEQELRKGVALAFDIVKHRKSPATKAEYGRVAKRLEKAGVSDNDSLVKYCEDKKLGQGTYYNLRAGLEYKLAEGLLEARRDKNIDKQRDLAKKLVSLQPGKPGSRANLSRKAAYRGQGTHRSKRNGLFRLRKENPNWKEQVLNSVSDKYKDQIAVLTLTGCRPSELKNGVLVAREGDSIKFKIIGSKKSSVSGADRTFCVSKLECGEDRWAAWGQLAAGLTEDGAHKYVRIKSTKALAAEIHKAAGKAGLAGVSAYSFRHDFKDSISAEGGVSGFEASEALGHAALGTKTAYGAGAGGGVRGMTLRMRR